MNFTMEYGPSYWPFPLEFRQGGEYGSYGIWLKIDRQTEVLIHPVHLAYSFENREDDAYMFLGESHEDTYIEPPLTLRRSFIDYNSSEVTWWFDDKDGNEDYRVWNTEEYTRKASVAISALYKHSVIEMKPDAYHFGAIPASRAMYRLLISNDYPKPGIVIHPEPFSASMVAGEAVTMRISDREVVLPIKTSWTSPLESGEDWSLEYPCLLIHELENIVSDGVCNFGYWSSEIRHIDNCEWLPRSLRDGSYVWIYAMDSIWRDNPKGIAGICSTHEVVSSLYNAIRQAYPELYPSMIIEHFLK